MISKRTREGRAQNSGAKRSSIFPALSDSEHSSKASSTMTKGIMDALEWDFWKDGIIKLAWKQSLSLDHFSGHQRHTGIEICNLSCYGSHDIVTIAALWIVPREV